MIAREALLGLLLFSLTAWRVTATYPVFNQTFDEPFHLACGMQWWSEGRYTLEVLHPPLARILVAMGPYLDGNRFAGRGDIFREGAEQLYGRGRYWETLSLARLGQLPLLGLAMLSVYGIAKSLWGRWAGVAAAALFAHLPAVLGHAAVATTDLAATAGLALCLWSMLEWLRQPTPARAAAVGLAAAVALGSKMSLALFVPFSWTLLLALHARRPPARHVALAAAVAFFALWGLYRFSCVSMASLRPRLNARLVERLGPGRLCDLAITLGAVPLPLMEYATGFSQVLGYNAEGLNSYFCGPTTRPSPWFFPVCLALKTPLAILVLSAIGLVAMIRAGRPAEVGLALSAVGLLVAVMPARINEGIGNVLPLCGPLALLAAAGVRALVASGSRPARAFAALLLVASLAPAALAHPDYLAYFNPLAGDHPETYLINSDLDWGQDLARLARRLDALRATPVHLSYFGSADPARLGLAGAQPLAPDRPVHGWVAISVFHRKARPGFGWLDAYPPVEVVGRSIWLYRIP